MQDIDASKNPFSRKIERGISEVSELYRQAFLHGVLDYLDDFSRENLPESLYKTMKHMVDDMQYHIRDHEVHYLFEDMEVVEEFLERCAPDKLTEVGDGVFDTTFAPINDTCAKKLIEKYGSKKVFTTKEGNFIVFSMYLNPRLHNDEITMLQNEVSFDSLVPEGHE